MGSPKLRHSFLGIALEWCRAHSSRGSYWEMEERWLEGTWAAREGHLFCFRQGHCNKGENKCDLHVYNLRNRNRESLLSLLCKLPEPQQHELGKVQKIPSYSCWSRQEGEGRRVLRPLLWSPCQATLPWDHAAGPAERQVMLGPEQGKNNNLEGCFLLCKGAIYKPSCLEYAHSMGNNWQKSFRRL